MRDACRWTAAALAALVALGAGAPVAAGAEEITGRELRLLDLANDVRSEQGTVSLQTDDCLMREADLLARKMARADRLRHFPTFALRERCAMTLVVENIAVNKRAVDVSEVVEAWEQSSGHRANLLDTRVNRFGVGTARTKGLTYYSLVLARTLEPDPPAEPVDLAALRSDSVSAIDELRREAGVGPLVPSTCLDRFSGAYAEQLAAGTGLPDGGLAAVRSSCDLTRVGWSPASEVATAREAVDQWLSNGYGVNLAAVESSLLSVGVAEDTRGFAHVVALTGAPRTPRAARPGTIPTGPGSDPDLPGHLGVIPSPLSSGPHGTTFALLASLWAGDDTSGDEGADEFPAGSKAVLEVYGCRGNTPTLRATRVWDEPVALVADDLIGRVSSSALGKRFEVRGYVVKDHELLLADTWRYTIPATLRRPCDLRKRQARPSFAGSEWAVTWQPRSSFVAPSPPAPAVDAAAVDRALVDLTNEARAEAGVHRLLVDGCLDTYAEAHARSQAEAEAMSHQDLTSAAAECGATFVSENVAQGSADPEVVHRTWMTSEGHRNNILAPEWTHVAVGVAQDRVGNVYYSVVFAAVEGR